MKEVRGRNKLRIINYELRMQEEIKNLIKEALTKFEIETSDIVLEHPTDLKNGDYSSNILLSLKKEQLYKILENLKEDSLGEEKADFRKLKIEFIKSELEKNKIKSVDRIEIVGAGFINFYLSREFFSKNIEQILNEGLDFGKNKILEGKKMMVEYTQPNPFKPFHIGHLMSNAIGESISRLVEFSGAETMRANYQGDIGLHVAKAIWGLMKDEKLQSKAGDHNLQASNIGKAYVLGANTYETDEQVKKEIDELNKKIYERTDEKINAIYDWGFEVTMDAFEDLYKMLGTKFDYYFLESAMSDIGREIVNANKGKIFEESDDAIVFKAEKYDPKLHTRVFITKTGLPTYETKELGLTEEKFKTYPEMDLSIVVTANEQLDYMRVVVKAISLLHPEFENRMKHITHGMMRLASGKMGSRKGNAITGESLINDACDAVSEKMKDRDFLEH